jgi:hypothetical protein
MQPGFLLILHNQSRMAIGKASATMAGICANPVYLTWVCALSKITYILPN